MIRIVSCVRRISALSFLLFFTILPCDASESLPHVQRFIKKFEAQKSSLQGGAVAVLHQGRVIYKKTFGYQQGQKRPVTSSTLFPLASVSKPVCAMGVALMVEEGMLSFDQLFNLSCLHHRVTLAHILSHTTGYRFSGNTFIERGLGRATLLSKLKKTKPQSLPGECYFYSNTLFSLVEDVLKTQNLTLQDAIVKLRSNLNIHDLQILPLTSRHNVAYPHIRQSTQTRYHLKTLPFPPYYPQITPAAAGVFASLDSMIEFFKLSFGYRPDLISQETLDRLHTPIAQNDDIQRWRAVWPIDVHEIQSYYGMGWRILNVQSYPHHKFIFHGGFISGIVTFIGFIPSQELGLIILINEKSSLPFENAVSLWVDCLN